MFPGVQQNPYIQGEAFGGLPIPLTADEFINQNGGIEVLRRGDGNLLEKIYNTYLSDDMTVNSMGHHHDFDAMIKEVLLQVDMNILATNITREYPRLERAAQQELLNNINQLATCPALDFGEALLPIVSILDDLN